MKKSIVTFMMLLLFGWTQAQNLLPYIKAFETTETVSATAEKLQANLGDNGIKVVGKYQPANDKNRFVLIITSPELEGAVKKTGGLAGFALTLRVAITSENGKTIVSYTNPTYWGNAYFRGSYTGISPFYGILTQHLESAMKATGTFTGTPFGSKSGLSAAELRKYHYMMGMPYFEDNVELASFSNYAAAISKIESSIKNGVPNVALVYKTSVPGTELTLYGFALSGEKGESKFLPTIDISSPKHTAFLPYEVLVMGNKVLMLHGRYRIALSFPDLTMGTFTKIMSTPGDIEDLLKKLVK